MRTLLLTAALLMLTSCASFGKARIEFAPVKVDCAVFDAPKAEQPSEPGLRSTLPEWQLYAWGWQAYAEGVLNQRVETAQCMARLREVGIIK